MPRRKRRNILVTGVTSTVGRHLTEHLLADKRVGKIMGVAHVDRPYYFNEFDKERFLYGRHDILKYRDLNNLFRSDAFKKAEIDTVVHLAFISSPMAKGRNVHRLNVDGTKYLLDRCIESGQVRKFVFKSSDVVYKLKPHNPVYLDEKTDLNFDTQADQWIKDRVDADMICRSRMDNKKTKIVVLRFSNIIGRGVAGHFNAYFNDRVIFAPMGFNPLINLIHMRDVLHALVLAIFKNVHGVFNIGGLDTAPLRTIAELAGARVIPLPEPLLGPVNAIQRALGMTRYYYRVDAERQKYTGILDDSRARKILGYKPTGRIQFD
ncbi:MAG: NAD-dependent epimerase/dehydratase family protein [Deltaproteobacteria bacterium]|nr:NAD-dependent epimerase/dehydratase family protein [Deltaproteobacteria bacterium]